MQPYLSIIIPVYKVEKYLPQCLDSIVTEITSLNMGTDSSQTEVLVIDDGSPDSSGEIADSYAGKYPFLQALHQQNAGVAAARNKGMDLAKGEWLYFVDSDDWMAEGGIAALLKRTQESPDADIILLDAFQNAGNREYVWEHFAKEAIWKEKQQIRGLQRGVLYFKSAGIKTKIPLAAPWDKVYRRKFLLEKGIRFHTDLKVLDDMVFNMTAFGEAVKVAYYKDKIYHYRYVADSITNSYQADRVIKDCQVWEYIDSYMTGQSEQADFREEEKEKFRQAYYCRIIKSFSICCRLSFFHVRNNRRFKDKLRYLKSVLRREPYRTAFRSVKIRNAEWKLKAVIFLGRYRFSFGIYLLHKAQSLLK